MKYPRHLLLEGIEESALFFFPSSALRSRVPPLLQGGLGQESLIQLGTTTALIGVVVAFFFLLHEMRKV